MWKENDRRREKDFLNREAPEDEDDDDKEEEELDTGANLLEQSAMIPTITPLSPIRACPGDPRVRKASDAGSGQDKEEEQAAP